MFPFFTRNAADPAPPNFSIQELASVIDAVDTKRTNFYLSTLLSTVLSHHLAWVPTVTPPADSLVEEEEKYDSTPSPLELQARYFPYNPLWAQLTDLYGSIGNPATMGKTVVVGQNQALVNSILYILTYFIRCSEVFENVERLDPPVGTAGSPPNFVPPFLHLSFSELSRFTVVPLSVSAHPLEMTSTRTAEIGQAPAPHYQKILETTGTILWTL